MNHWKVEWGVRASAKCVSIEISHKVKRAFHKFLKGFLFHNRFSPSPFPFAKAEKQEFVPVCFSLDFRTSVMQFFLTQKATERFYIFQKIFSFSAWCQWKFLKTSWNKSRCSSRWISSVFKIALVEVLFSKIKFMR